MAELLPADVTGAAKELLGELRAQLAQAQQQMHERHERLREYREGARTQESYDDITAQMRELVTRHHLEVAPIERMIDRIAGHLAFIESCRNVLTYVITDPNSPPTPTCGI